jgi:hypothetical protein
MTHDLTSFLVEPLTMNPIRRTSSLSFTDVDKGKLRHSRQCVSCCAALDATATSIVKFPLAKHQMIHLVKMRIGKKPVRLQSLFVHSFNLVGIGTKK